jgi:hypothetical protein
MHVRSSFGRTARMTLALVPMLFLIACGSGASGAAAPVGASQAATPPVTLAAQVKLQGVVRAGTAALAGSSVTLYAAAPPGQMPQSLAHALSDSSGAFELSATCPSSTAGTEPLYVSASGGQISGTDTAQPVTNPAIRLVAVLGTCDELPATVTVNELATIAAAYALKAFISGNEIAGDAPGLPNAAAAAASLVNSSSGTLAASLPSAAACSGATPAINCETVAKLDALANALAACLVSGNSSSQACAALFSCATPGAAADGSALCAPPSGATSPTDTWQAITSIARYPGLISAAGLYTAASSSIEHAPVPTSAPSDWTLSLTYTGGGLSEPTALAVDAAGNIWVANYNDAISEFSPTGTALSPAGGYTGGGLEESFGIAIDATGHVWVCNEQSSSAFNAGLGSITELAADGTILSGASGFDGGGLDFPEALMVDANAQIWVANYGNSTLTALASNGMAISPASGFTGGGMSFPVGLAADAAGNIWVANQGASQISVFSEAGAALSPATGYSGGGITVPQGIAADQHGNVWVSNYYGDSISEFSNLGVALSPSTGYGGGGLAAPGGIAIDGAGQVWIANFQGGSVSELAGAGANAPGSVLSSANGFTASALVQPFAVAIDPSGNLWVTNFGGNSVTEFIGVAEPVKTPLIGVPKSPQ